MRTIDADVFKEKLLKERNAIPLTFKERYGFEMPNKHGNSMRGGIRKALRCMEETPTIDAVQVVRCKDCKMQWGCKSAQYLGNDGFCSIGERKEGD